MTINRTHLAGLCRAIDEIGGIASGEVTATLNRLIAQAQAAPEAEPVAWRWLYNGKPDGPYAFNYPLPDADVVARGLAAEHPRTVQPLYTAPQHDAELVELLRDCYPGCGLTARQTAQLRKRIDAKLASLRRGEK